MAYSILRKTISIITVCGQAQPHQSRPNAVVNTMMPTAKTSSADGEDDHVLRPENLAQHHELALHDVHQQQRIAVDGDERPGEHDQQQQPAKPGAPAEKPPADLARINPLAPALLVGGGDMVAEVRPVHRLERTSDGSGLSDSWVAAGGDAKSAADVPQCLFKLAGPAGLAGAWFSGGLPGVASLAPRSV